MGDGEEGRLGALDQRSRHALHAAPRQESRVGGLALGRSEDGSTRRGGLAEALQRVAYWGCSALGEGRFAVDGSAAVERQQQALEELIVCGDRLVHRLALCWGRRSELPDARRQCGQQLAGQAGGGEGADRHQVLKQFKRGLLGLLGGQG